MTAGREKLTRRYRAISYLLEAVRDPKNPEHDDLVEWLGEDFDPEAFDLDEVNRRLKEIP